MNRQNECGACPLGSRRAFLGRVSGALAIVALDDDWLAAFGATAVSEVTAEQSTANALTYPAPAGDGVSIDKKEQIILVRYQQKVYAFPLACPHENTALRWRQRDLRFQCERHGSRYQPDGTFMTGRATRNMDRYAVSHNGGSIVVDLTKLYQSDSHAAEWAAAAAPA